MKRMRSDPVSIMITVKIMAKATAPIHAVRALSGVLGSMVMSGIVDP